MCESTHGSEHQLCFVNHDLSVMVINTLAYCVSAPAGHHNVLLSILTILKFDWVMVPAGHSNALLTIQSSTAGLRKTFWLTEPKKTKQEFIFKSKSNIYMKMCCILFWHKKLYMINLWIILCLKLFKVTNTNSCRFLCLT